MGNRLSIEKSDEALAERLAALRRERGLSLDQAAEQSGISRATLSRIERSETSPTAHVLGRLSAAYGVTMSALLTCLDEAQEKVRPRSQAAKWTDPETGLQRWSISPPAHGYEIELVWSELPPNARIEYPAPAYAGMEQHIIVFDGMLWFEAQGAIYELRRDDVLRVKLYGSSALENRGRATAKYLIAVRSSK